MSHSHASYISPRSCLKALEAGKAPCAALVSYDDIYVERAFSEKTAS